MPDIKMREKKASMFEFILLSRCLSINQSWATIGDLEEIRGDGHAVLSFGPLELLCLADEKPP